MASQRMEEIARRAIDRSTLRAALLLDRNLTVCWAQPTVAQLLGHGVDALVGTSALDYLHPDDVGSVAAILAYEQDIDVSVRSSVVARSVRMIRVRCGDGAWRSFEASLSNQYDDPEVGYLLIDVQAPSQLNVAHRAIELTRLGAELPEVLATILAQLTAADPGGVAAMIVDVDETTLAATPNSPAPHGSGDPASFRCTWSLPLVDASSDEPYGMLRAWCMLPTPHPLDLESSERIAGHAAVVIGRHRALQDLRVAALRDPLTGLANRRALEIDLHDRRRAGEEVLVAYIDLDGFKAVNDRIGHDAGDEVLITVADRLRRSLRNGDVIARMGGDEFVLLVAAPTPPRDAIRDRLQMIISAPMVINDQVVSISASIGLSEGPATATDLLRHADREMLSLKRVH